MPDRIIREIPLIERYARHNEAEDYRFRAFLKTRLDLSNAELDKIVRETTDEVWKQIDCTSCAQCCRVLHIVVDDQDIKRLAKRLGMSPKQFSQRYVEVSPDGIKQFAALPCPMLGPDNRCTVYEDRPKACREFPYFYMGGFRQRTLMTIENTALCPIAFNVWQRLKQRFQPRKR